MTLPVRTPLPMLVALGLAVSACGGAATSLLPTRAPNSSVPSNPPTPVTSVPPEQTATLEGGELLIRTDNGEQRRYVPDVVTARPGVEITLIFENVSTLPHGLRFDAPIGVSTAPSVAPNESENLKFTAPEPGEYAFICPVHPDVMKGTLRVSQ